ncbi:unnamed protein product [Schistosoma margrebowiei]|uniref:Uncharacterized protein n=1 Tax=Schistosoma margrebowiei TaxID=48269 RepID=A0A183LNV4_9TREM|nr:unnamed protein product [Schistosoma margrebowiei]
MSSTFNVLSLIIVHIIFSYLNTKTCCLVQNNTCEFLPVMEESCLLYALGKKEYVSKNDIQKLGSSTVNPNTVNEMRNSCKQTRNCTVRLTQCMSPAFEDLKCEIDPVLIQMCRNFNIQVKDNGNSGKAVCV